jgi:hypothetical protein
MLDQFFSAESEDRSFRVYAQTNKSPVNWGFFVFLPLAIFSRLVVAGG